MNVCPVVNVRARKAVRKHFKETTGEEPFYPGENKSMANLNYIVYLEDIATKVFIEMETKAKEINNDSKRKKNRRDRERNKTTDKAAG
jgi:TfoX/Sxy family transcriptional regulator of competence genes